MRARAGQSSAGCFERPQQFFEFEEAAHTAEVRRTRMNTGDSNISWRESHFLNERSKPSTRCSAIPRKARMRRIQVRAFSVTIACSTIQNFNSEVVFIFI